MTMPSTSLSTASEPNAAAKLTRPDSRLSTYARASSPARAGTTLFAMIPIAVARQSWRNGRFGATGCRMYRQRQARTGNASVATSAASTNMGIFESRRTCQTSCSETPCSAHASSAALSSSPTTPRQPSFIR